MLKLLINYAEKGILPDFIIRIGIIKLCKDRLSLAKEIGIEAVENSHQKFVENLKNSPIALVPEKVNEQHYEVPSIFFETVLGQNLKYSSGFWGNNISNLAESENLMLNITSKNAALEDSMDILELGCGWGSLTCFMAKKYPNSRIVAVSNSADQRQYIINRCKNQGISNVQLITADMNDFNIQKKFDRVISVEMFEHMRNYKLLLEKINTFLKPDGKLFVHIFSHNQIAYPFEDKHEGDWMAREFFSGGIMPSHRLLLYFQDHLKIENVWRFSGEHYSKTSWAWLKNMDNNKEKILKIFSDTYGHNNSKIWWQRWRIFFMSCAELFGMNKGSEWGVSHYLFYKNIREKT